MRTEKGRNNQWGMWCCWAERGEAERAWVKEKYREEQETPHEAQKHKEEKWWTRNRREKNQFNWHETEAGSQITRELFFSKCQLKQHFTKVYRRRRRRQSMQLSWGGREVDFSAHPVLLLSVLPSVLELTVWSLVLRWTALLFKHWRLKTMA